MPKFYLFTYFTTLLLLLIVENCQGAVKDITMAIDTDTSIYYDLKTNETLPIESADASRVPFQPIKLISRGLPCSCSNLKCGCCAGVNLTAINFRRRACTNVTLVPEEFALDFNLLMDDKQVFSNRVSGRNPPAACVPLYFLPVVTFCVRFFDLHLAENKLNACIDFETRVAQWPMFILHFNCVKIGGNGITWVRPDGGPPLPLIANVSDPEVYDDVNFEALDENSYSHTSTLTPEEEDQIGTLKL